MTGGQYFPAMPDAKIEPILTEKQRTVWKGVNKNNIRFGINFGFARGVEIEDEVWDDEPPVKKPAKPDDAAPPKNGPVPKAAAKR